MTWRPRDTFSGRLVQLRHAKGWTVQEAAEACGLPAPTWYKWEGGARPRDLLRVVDQITAGTGVDRLWLLAPEEEEDPGSPGIPVESSCTVVSSTADVDLTRHSFSDWLPDRQLIA